MRNNASFYEDYVDSKITVDNQYGIDDNQHMETNKTNYYDKKRSECDVKAKKQMAAEELEALHATVRHAREYVKVNFAECPQAEVILESARKTVAKLAMAAF